MQRRVLCSAHTSVTLKRGACIGTAACMHARDDVAVRVASSRFVLQRGFVHSAQSMDGASARRRSRQTAHAPRRQSFLGLVQPTSPSPQSIQLSGPPSSPNSPAPSSPPSSPPRPVKASLNCWVDAGWPAGGSCWLACPNSRIGL
eukprot:6204071-Pleurochrysis_carterae.AAC.5